MYSTIVCGSPAPRIAEQFTCLCCAHLSRIELIQEYDDAPTFCRGHVVAPQQLAGSQRTSRGKPVFTHCQPIDRTTPYFLELPSLCPTCVHVTATSSPMLSAPSVVSGSDHVEIGSANDRCTKLRGSGWYSTGTLGRYSCSTFPPGTSTYVGVFYGSWNSPQTV